MQFLFDRINEFKKIKPFTKHEQLVNAITSSIESKELKKGDKLPSINKMVTEVGFARKTIVKAYEELKGKGIVESKNFKGYYIADINTKTKLRVALVLYAFHTFQEDFYNAFREELGENYIINVFFHHNNLDTFKNIFSRISGRYGMYIVAPIQTPEVKPILQNFPEDKLLIVDRFINLTPKYSYIAQEFENSTYNQLIKLTEQIKKYEEFVLFYRADSDYPVGILNAYKRFVKEYKINSSIKNHYKKGSVEKNKLYFFISDSYLWSLLRDSKAKAYTIGKDIGVL
ncbi:hypothetical protein MHTCC0001_17640 [Flavobacteriaceae bacterium MHTCC 0001]